MLKIDKLDDTNTNFGVLINDLDTKIKMLNKNFKFFQADETESKIGNLELAVKEFKGKINIIRQEQVENKKKINVLTSVSKLFKGHIKNREIHLQD